MDEQTENVKEELDFGTDTELQAEPVNQDDSTEAPVEETTEQVGSEEDQPSEPTGEDLKTNTDEAEPNTMADFLKSKGLDPSDPEALTKVTEMYRNSEKKMYEESQKRAQLERAFTQPTQPLPGDTAALAEVKALKNQMMAREFIERNKITPDDEMKLVDYLSQPVALPTGGSMPRAQLVVDGLLSLDEAYRLAGGKTESADQIKADLKAQVLKDVAARQNSKLMKASATNSKEFANPDANDPFLKGFSEE